MIVTPSLESGTQGQRTNVIERVLMYKIFYDGGRRTPWIDTPESMVESRDLTKGKEQAKRG